MWHCDGWTPAKNRAVQQKSLPKIHVKTHPKHKGHVSTSYQPDKSYNKHRNTALYLAAIGNGLEARATESVDCEGWDGHGNSHTQTNVSCNVDRIWGALQAEQAKGFVTLSLIWKAKKSWWKGRMA